MLKGEGCFYAVWSDGDYGAKIITCKQMNVGHTYEKVHNSELSVISNRTTKNQPTQRTKQSIGKMSGRGMPIP